jgi:hypothetical protein
LSSRIGPDDYGKVVSALCTRVPIPTIEEQHYLKLAAREREAARERRDKLERGEDGPGSLSGKVWTRKDAERLIGRELFEMAIRVGSLDEAWLTEIEKLHRQVRAVLGQSRLH